MLPSLLLLATTFLGVTTAASARSSPVQRQAGEPALAERADLERRQIYRLSLTNATSAPSGTGILPVELSSDKQSYYAVVSVGNASFRLALDTGSADTWLVSSDCKTSTCKKVPTYPLSYQSPSFVSVNNNGTTFNVSYADSTAATGFVALETISLSNITVAQQSIGLVKTSNVALDDDISGVLGLSFPRLSTITNSNSTAVPIVASMAQRGLLSYPVFGVSIPRNTTGSLTFGAVDTSVLTNFSNIQWNEVIEFSPFGAERNASGYLQWAIALRGINIGGTSIKPQPTYANATQNISIALLDIGTRGIFGPYQDVARIFDSVDGSRLVDQNGQWSIPCDSSMTMSFNFGGTNFTLQPTDYLIGPAAGNPQQCLAWPRAITPSSDGIDWQFGSAFLSTVYSIFNYGIDTKEAPMVGLYPLSTVVTPEPESVVSAYFSSASATVATTLPNSLLSTPTFTTPPYAFNTSVPASAGAIVSSDLATSTYSPLLRNTARWNASALPTASPSATLATFIVTDAGGVVYTSTSTAAAASVTLGVPAGWTSGAARAWTLPVSPVISSLFIALISLSAWTV